MRNSCRYFGAKNRRAIMVNKTNNNKFGGGDDLGRREYGCARSAPEPVKPWPRPSESGNRRTFHGTLVPGTALKGTAADRRAPAARRTRVNIVTAGQGLLTFHRRRPRPVDRPTLAPTHPPTRRRRRRPSLTAARVRHNVPYAPGTGTAVTAITARPLDFCRFVAQS